MPSPSPQPADHIFFRLATEWYALPVSQMRTIDRWQAPTPVPGTQPAILGIVSQRGAIITVIDARVLIGLPIEPPARSTRLLGVQHGDVPLALVADRVADLLPLDPADVQPVPGGRAASLSAGLARTPFGPTSLLSLEALLEMVRGGQ